MTFTKLFSSITESTIWQENEHTRLVWITMLAMADRLGRVWASVPGLASRARVPVQSTRKALKAFMSPDPDSRTKEHQGRRIEEIDGGWRLINHAKYKAIRDEEAIKESKRKYINNRRAKERVEKVELCRANAEAEAEAEGGPECPPVLPLTASQLIADEKYLKRLEKGIGVIRGQFPLPKDSPLRVELSELKTEQTKVMDRLGYKA